MTAKVRSMLLAASLVLFACLLFSGGQRLIGCDAAQDQVGFKITQRVDGRLLLRESVKCLQMKAA